jgi:transposase
MSNVLSEEEKQKILALGRMGWSLRRIARETGMYRDTVSRYLREASITVRKPGRPGKETAKPAISAAEVTTDSTLANTKPAIKVTPDSSLGKPPTPSSCEPFRDIIEEALARGRNAKAIWQDLVDDHSFTGSYQSVKRFVRRHAGPDTPDARAIIITPPGEHYVGSRVMVSGGADRSLLGESAPRSGLVRYITRYRASSHSMRLDDSRGVGACVA